MDYQLGPGPLQVDQNTIDEKIKGDIGIVENGDVATHAITSGYYVIWKGDLYIAKTDISSGTTLSAASSGNLTAKPNGLGAEVASLIGSLPTKLNWVVRGSTTALINDSTFYGEVLYTNVEGTPNKDYYYKGYCFGKLQILVSNFTWETRRLYWREQQDGNPKVWTSWATFAERTDVSPTTVSNTPTYNTNIINQEMTIRKTGSLVTGYLVFAYNSSFAGGDGMQQIITNDNGLPAALVDNQLPLICVAGTNAGKVGRVRITTTGYLQFFYSNVKGAAGETYLIPINYIAK